MRKALAALAACACLAAAAATFDPVVPGKPLEFPHDYGAHPGYRLEWWYLTGNLEGAHGPLGFQVTFFRVRNPDGEGHASRFSPAQLLFAHAALSDPALGHLLHDQRSARAYDDLVAARTADTDVRIDDWSLAREDGAYRTRIEGDDFALELAAVPTQPPLLEGDRGFSRKGPLPSQASWYYSEPQLHVTGRVRTAAGTQEVSGVAWLDHEWSSEYLAPEAAGWDWLGANLDDGTALMAFRMRGKDGSVLWSQATLRAKGAAPVSYSGDAVRFTPRRHWKSPRTGIDYPVAMSVEVAGRRWALEPLMDDQELDARGSTGTLYWEGAVRVAGEGTSAGGQGYLELTGYAERVPF
jgi:predicted secreted hydrolase